MQPVLDRNHIGLNTDETLPVSGLRRMFPRIQTRQLYGLGGVVFIMLTWHALAQRTHTAIVASPADTWAALQHLATSGQLWTQMVVTLCRLLLALTAGGALGFGLGLAAGFSAAWRAFLEPLRWVIMTLPTIFVAVMGLLWFGMGNVQVVFLVTLITSPVIYVNTVSGFDALDRQLVEMGRVYRFSRWQSFTQIYLPGIGGSILTGLTLAAGIGVRAVIIAELMGAFEGMGHSFNQAWTFLKTPEMFAWMLASLGLMGLVEFGLLRPLSRYVTRWKRQGQDVS